MTGGVQHADVTEGVEAVDLPADRVADRNASEHSRLIVSTSTLLIARQSVVALAGAVATAVLARALSVSQFGMYSSVLATFYFAMSACDLGFGTVVARELAARPDDEAALMRAGVRAATSWSVAIAGGLFLCTAIAGGPRDRLLCVLALVPALALAGANTARQVLIVRYQVRRVAAVDIACNVVMASGLICFGVVGTPLWVLAATVCLTMALNTLLVSALARRIAGAGGTTWRHAATLTRQALPFGAASFLASAYFTIDLVVAAYLLDARAIAPYAAAVKLLTLMTGVASLLMSVSLAGLSAVNTRDDRYELNDLLARLWRFQFVVIGGACVFVLSFASTVVQILFGAKYGSTAPLVRILMAAAMTALASGLLGCIMVARHRARSMLWQTAIALTLNVALNVALLPHFGTTVAAWTTLATEGFVLAWSAVSLRRVLLWRSLGRATVGPVVSLALMLAGALVPGPLAVKVVCALGLFAVALLVTRSVPEELRALAGGLRVRLPGAARRAPSWATADSTSSSRHIPRHPAPAAASHRSRIGEEPL